MLKKHMNLKEYVELIKCGEYMPLSAHEHTYQAIQYAKQEKLFKEDVNEKLLDHLIQQYFLPASMGYDLHKRMLILVGPPGSGKSSIVRFIKRAIEEFSRTDQGALFEIEGCPMQENPLLALPNDVRNQLPSINGELSPFNQLRLQGEWKNNWENIPVKRFYISENGRKGIGTFFPGDPYSQDISDLIGAVDFSTITTYGSSGDPRAYRYDGEFQAANRGLLELQEVFKTSQQLLYPFLTLAEEKEYKIPRQTLITADQVVIGHTNEEDLKSFMENKQNQSILNRMVIVKVPYNLKLDQEVTIYKRKIKTKDEKRFGLFALETLAVAIILTRLKKSAFPITLLEKLEKINMDKVDQSLINEFTDEGMQGLDPRYAFHVLSVICAKGLTIIEANDLLAELEDLLRHDYRINSSQKEHYIYALQLARKYYENSWVTLIKEIIMANNSNKLQQLLNSYVTKESNSLHKQLGIDETNVKHFESAWQSLIGSSEHIMFNDLPQSFQEVILQLYLIQQHDHLTGWYGHTIEPELEVRGIQLSNRAQTQVIDILNQYINNLY